VITIGRDRAESIQRMQRALAEFVILGVQTNLVYLQAILELPAFQRGELSTHFLDEHLKGWQPESIALPDEALAAIALHDLVGARGTGGGTASAGPDEAVTPWTTLPGWRHLQNGGAA